MLDIYRNVLTGHKTFFNNTIFQFQTSLRVSILLNPSILIHLFLNVLSICQKVKNKRDLWAFNKEMDPSRYGLDR